MYIILSNALINKITYVKHFLQHIRPKIKATEHPKTAGSIIQAQQMMDPLTMP